MIEQIFRIYAQPNPAGESHQRCAVSLLKKSGIFVVSALAALLAVFFLPERISLLAGIVIALMFSFLFEFCYEQYTKGIKP
jgi:hypothetical protein